MHVYCVDGLLIDTGHSLKRKKIVNQLRELDVSQIFITHHHEDHTGNLRPLKNELNVPVYGSERCAELMKNPPKLSFIQKKFWGGRESFEDIQPISNSISTNQFTFDLIPIPGHAEDMLALYEKEKGWLFSADLFIHSRIGYFLKGENIYQQIDSIKRVLELDFDVMFCAHNPQLKNGKRKLQQKLDYLEDFAGGVRNYHSKGMNASEIFKAMKLEEVTLIKLLSGGLLSKRNMVKSVLEGITE